MISFVSKKKAAEMYNRLIKMMSFDSRAARINEVFGSPDHQPVVLIDRPVARYEKSSYYSMADCCIVNVIRDGMNLVPYKYIVVNHGVIRVNPWDIESVAGAISSALIMKETEKQLRHKKHYRYVSSLDVAYWARSFMQDLERASKDHYNKRCWGIGFGLGFRVVMAAPVIPISSDSSEESVGSHVPRVILFGAIPAIIHVIHGIPAEVPIIPADLVVAPEVGAVFVTSPARVLDLVDYSSSDSDPSEDSLPPAPELPLVSPFLCSDDSEAGPSSPSGSSYDDTFAPSSELPVAPVVAPPGIRRRAAILIRPGKAIPFGRPCRTHPNGPRKLLNARKRVGPFPARRLAWRRVSLCSSDRHSSQDFTSDSSSSGSSSDSSSDTFSGSPPDSLSDTSSVHSSGCDASGQTHLGPSTRVASYRLVYPPVMTPRYSEAFSRWRLMTSNNVTFIASFILLIMEYLVKISKKVRILELKRRNMKITDPDIQYAVSIKEDMACMCLHFTKDHEGNKINTPYPGKTNTPYSRYRM
ncbi:probable alpha,alpha-trehalose-phosphate synthase [UDP-forming] 10 [Tanacetum coccineum]